MEKGMKRGRKGGERMQASQWERMQASQLEREGESGGGRKQRSKREGDEEGKNSQRKAVKQGAQS
eukprot:1581162-Pleurochrysis_carterae.AAC.2